MFSTQRVIKEKNIFFISNQKNISFIQTNEFRLEIHS